VDNKKCFDTVDVRYKHEEYKQIFCSRNFLWQMRRGISDCNPSGTPSIESSLNSFIRAVLIRFTCLSQIFKSCQFFKWHTHTHTHTYAIHEWPWAHQILHKSVYFSDVFLKPRHFTALCCKVTVKMKQWSYGRQRCYWYDVFRNVCWCNGDLAIMFLELINRKGIWK
jgi:hypothetical protein